ncbi:hypothetical protein BCV71DRAFT_239147 [Rhizopus microsporus]|uniref:Uncharacterized protein n=1 Tax=Rhizopus microsporus TaxID=58291 RepID=A0A1X0RNV2_RHIZD|nr:hypothetical protein BCV71DRAFT_239147 [Rhizopus microsporus]
MYYDQTCHFISYRTSAAPENNEINSNHLNCPSMHKWVALYALLSRVNQCLCCTEYLERIIFKSLGRLNISLTIPVPHFNIEVILTNNSNIKTLQVESQSLINLDVVKIKRVNAISKIATWFCYHDAIIVRKLMALQQRFNDSPFSVKLLIGNEIQECSIRHPHSQIFCL